MPIEGSGPAPSLAQQKLQESFLNCVGAINGAKDLDITIAREFLSAVEDCVRGFNIVAILDGEIASGIRCAVLQSGFPALLWCRRGNGAAGFDWIARMWELHASAFGVPRAVAGVRNPDAQQLEKAVLPGAGVEEEMAIYNAAVSELLAQRGREARIRQALRRLRTHLGMDYDEAGRMLGMPHEMVRRWESGEVEVPDSERAAIFGADAALTELLEIYRPERLPEVIRRPARLFDGQRALDWILAGRIQGVAERYRRTFLYQA
jgi:transcriptional regulator with XRE-family HTH domain